MVKNRWAKSQLKSSIPNETIIEGEIVVGGINSLVAEIR